VEGEAIGKGGGVGLEGGTGGGTAGVIDEDMNGVVFFQVQFRPFPYLLVVVEIRLDEVVGLSVIGGEFGADAGEQIKVTGQEGDGDAALGQGDGAGLSDAVGAAADECVFSGEVKHNYSEEAPTVRGIGGAFEFACS